MSLFTVEKRVLAEVFSLSVFIYHKCCCIYSTGDLADLCMVQVVQCPQPGP